jgi:hypothetical protein
VVSVGYELGSRVFSSLRVWGTAIALTFALCEGAGFGAFSYHCAWYDPFAAAGPQCTLIHQALLPPEVAWTTFAWNAATLWVAGFLDGGYVLGLILVALILGVASRASAGATMRIFSALPVVAACTLMFGLGFSYEVQATIASGLPQVP